MKKKVIIFSAPSGEEYDRELLVGEGFRVGVFGIGNVQGPPGRRETRERVLFLFNG